MTPLSCPVNGARCGRECVLREECERDPEGVREAMKRIDAEVLDVWWRLVREASDGEER